jgi:hypothetical protein
VSEAAPAEGAEPRVRVASVPAVDLYVDAVLPGDVARVLPAGPAALWLDADHLAAHAEDIDVLHLHVGYGHLSGADLEHWGEAVRRLGVPLVVTVHQLHDPVPETRARHETNLAAVLADAEVVLTLTPGAADEIADRFGRTAIVVAHPSVAEPVPGLGAERGTVGLVLGAPAPGRYAPDRLIRAALSGAVSGGGRLRVLAQPGDDVPAARELAAEDEIELVEVRRSGAAWAAALQELHVAVLAECGGTHSRDLEICRDVGTRVVAPGGGRFAEQWGDVVTYGDDEDGGLDTVSLAAAVAAALARPAPRPADPAWRADQRAAVRSVHAQVYAQVAADRLRV